MSEASIIISTNNPTWRPPRYVRQIKIEAWGGGGGGCYGSFDPLVPVGSNGYGGAGGGYACKNSYDVSYNKTYNLQIGTGGAPTDFPGNSGGTTQFKDGTNIICLATGGQSSGDGGEGIVGDTLFKGGPGTDPLHTPPATYVDGCGGGAAAGQYGNGTYGTWGSDGGTGVGGGGSGGRGTHDTTNNTAGQIPGGGGGGGGYNHLTGDYGAAGRLIITYTVPTNIMTSMFTNQG